MATTVSARASRVPAFEVMDLVRLAADRARRGGPPGPVCHLEVGQPSAPAPAAVLDAARAALDGPLGYTESLGTGELRRAVAGWYRSRHGIDVDPGRVAITAGASAACVLAFLACFDPGQRVGVFEPGYPCYRQILDSLGIEAVPVPLAAEHGYRPTPDQLTAHAPLDGLVVASPSNPTGTVLGPGDLDEVVGWCAEHDVRLIADEIYSGIEGNGTGGGAPAPTVAGVEGAVVVQSFSKYFRMTGWRLGWLVLPEDLVRPVERLSQNLYLAPPTLSQHAAVAAFDALDDLDAEVARYARTRALVIDGLSAVGVDRVAPADGAFYVWADVSHLGDSRDLCRTWLEDLAVAVTPGVDFDPVRGSDFVRCSVAGPTDEVAEAVARLAGWIGART